MNLLEKHWIDETNDKNYRQEVIGLESYEDTSFVKSKGEFKRNFFTAKDKFIEPCHFEMDFVTETYNGGRNEQFWFGPCFEDVWNDFDLSSAYPIAMSNIGKANWENIRVFNQSDLHKLDWNYRDEQTNC